MCIFKNIIEKNKIFVGTGKTANGVFFKKSGVTDESRYVTVIKNSQRIVLFDKVQYEFGVNNITSVIPANGGTYNVTASVSKKTHGDGTVENNISFSPTSFTVPANTGASYNSAVTITQSGSNLTQNCEYTVEADSVTSLTLTLNAPSNIPAAGGTVSSTTYTLKAYYKSGRVDNNVTTGTINWTAVTAASKGTVISNETTAGTLYASATFSGQTATASTYVKQQANYVTAIAASGSSSAAHFSYSNIAAGATSASPTLHGGGEYTFTSGSKKFDPSTSPSFGGTATYTRSNYTLASSQNGFTAVNSSNGTLTANSLGTTISNNRTSAAVTGKLVITYTHASSYSGGGTVTSPAYSSTATCTQTGNYVTAITVTTNPAITIAQFAAAGGSKTDSGTNGAVTYKFSSGSQTATAPGSTYGVLTTSASYTMTNGTGFYLTNATSGTISAQTKGTTVTGATTSNTITKSITYTWTPTASYNSQGTKTTSANTTGYATQAANAITSYVTPAITTKSYAAHDASSGTVTPTVKGSCYPVYTSTATGAQVTNITLTVTSATMTAGNGATINTSNGVVTWAANTTTTLGSPAAARTTNTITLKVSFGSTYSNLGASGTTTATQNADAIASTVISDLSSNTYTAATSPAPLSGTTITITGGKATVTYVSGAKFYPTATLSASTKTYGNLTGLTLSTTANTSATTQFTATSPNFGVYHANASYWTVTSTYEGVTKSLRLYYPTNAVTGSSAVNTVAYTQIPASGGTSTPPLNATFSWLYASGSRRNWKLGNAISLAETWGTMTTSVTYTMTNGNGFTLKSSSTGEVSAATKGTTVTGVTSSNTVTCVVNCSWVWASNRQYLNSGSTTATTSGTTKATQAANAVTSTAYGTPTISSPSAGASIGTIAAKGGTATPTKTASQSVTYTFTSTATSSKTNSTFTWTTTMTNGNGFYLTNATNGTISAATKGTTVSNATTSNTATIYAWANSKTGSTTYKAVQAANAVTSAWTATAQTAQGTASGTPTYGITTSTNSKTVQGGSDGTLNITATGKKYTPTCNTWKVASTPVSAYTSTAQKSGTTTTGSTVYSGTVTSSETSVATSVQSAPNWVNTAITGYYYKMNYTTAQRQGNLVFKVDENAATTKSVTITQTAGNPQTQPLAFDVISGYRINFSPFSSSSVMPPISYRINNGNWTAMVSGTPYINVSNGDMVYFEGPSSGITNISTSSSKGYGFRVDGGDDFEVMGNIMSLLGGNWTSNYTITEKYAFCGLFRNSMNITSAENLVLPATGLTDSCYSEMFEYCTYLTTAPSILPATTLAKYCYRYMFMECTSLTTAPALPATTLGSNCYSSMFRACRSLVTAPALPATVLVDSCYYSMFIDCTSLTTAPALSATTLVKYCYQSMFYGCTRLNYIKCLATNISASNCTSTWVSGVASSGTFVKKSSMTDWSTGTGGIPDGWTVTNVT